MARSSERGAAAKAGRGAAGRVASAPTRGVVRGAVVSGASGSGGASRKAVQTGSARSGAARSAVRVTEGRATDARTPRGAEATRLGRDDWLDAAYDAVVAGGFDAVRVLPLAETLGVSRGSFYWHFTDHAALVGALLDRWFERECDADRALEAARSDDPVADLRQLLDAALARGGADLKAMRFELAIRTLGGQDPAIGRRLAEVDALRMAVITEKFARVVGDRAEARDLAALLYVAVAGAHQAMARTGSRDGTAVYLRGVIAEHLIRRVAKAAPDAVS